MTDERILRTFAVKDGRLVLIRTLSWSDIDGLLELDNSLVKEGADMFFQKPYSLSSVLLTIRSMLDGGAGPAQYSPTEDTVD